MGTIKHGVLRWRGDIGAPDGHLSKSPIMVVAIGTSEVATFGASMLAHTDCNLAYYGMYRDITSNPAFPGVGADVTKKAVIYFRDPSTLEVLHFNYAAPIAADIETTPAGKRVKQSAVALIVGYINIVSGKSYVPLYGVYYERA